MKEICIIGPGLSMGGMERASTTLANTLDESGYHVVFIAILKNNHFFKLNSTITYYEPSNFNHKKLSLIKTIFWLRKKILSEQIRNVIAFNKFYASISLLALAFTGVRTVISERSSPLYTWPIHLRIFHKIVYSIFSPAGIISQTSIAAFYQRKYYGKRPRIKIIPNAIRDVQLFPEIRREKIVLAVGRLNEYNKGFDQLINAFLLLDRPDWRLYIVGNQEGASELKGQVQRLGISNRIEFLDSAKEMDILLAKASIFVIPSRSEGFPNALCEAMAAGIAVISFDFIAGPRDIIENEVNGIIVENGNVNALTEAIQLLIDDESKRLRLGQNALAGRNRFERTFIAKQYIQFALNS